MGQWMLEVLRKPKGTTTKSILYLLQVYAIIRQARVTHFSICCPANHQMLQSLVVHGHAYIMRVAHAQFPNFYFCLETYPMRKSGIGLFELMEKSHQTAVNILLWKIIPNNSKL